MRTRAHVQPVRRFGGAGAAAAPGSSAGLCDLAFYDPAYGAWAASKEHRRPLPPGRMVAFSWGCSPESVTTELARGAAGFIGKRASSERLVNALSQVARGRVVVQIGLGPGSGSRGDTDEAAAWPLTGREASVLAVSSQGRSNQEISEILMLNLNSIKSYIRSAYRKIGVTSRSQAVLWGVRHGLLSWAPEGTHWSAQAP